MRLSNNTSALFEGIHLSVHVSACNNINMHTGVQKSETIENIENPSEEGLSQHQVLQQRVTETGSFVSTARSGIAKVTTPSEGQYIKRCSRKITKCTKESISSLSCSVSEDEQRFLNHFSGGKPGQTLEVDSEVFTDESQRWISVSNRRECVRRRTAERMTPQ